MSQALLLVTEEACNAIAQKANVSAYQSLFSTVQFDTGIDNVNLKAPCVISAAIEATPEPPDVPSVGNYVVKTSIIVKERAKKTTTATTLADTIFRQFLTGSIENDLISNAPNYFVHHAWVDNQMSGQEGKMWVSQLNLNIMCCSTQ
jgi:hypothetical protein